MIARLGLVTAVLLAAGCIRVPDQVKLNFCAQAGTQNHFGSGQAASSCCPGQRQVYRFGAERRRCER